MSDQTIGNIQATYDKVADEYVAHIYDELRHKPLDRELLDRFAFRMRGEGVVCDIGCGPGHVARYLQEQGAEVCGVDLSHGMVERARRLNPGIEFEQGDLLALDVADGTWVGLVAFYSIIHLPREEVVRALCELKRVLRPGGLLLLAFHIGDDLIHRDELWGHEVCIDFLLFRPDEMAGYLHAAGFEIEEIFLRDPYPDVEHQSRRAYIFAQSQLIGRDRNLRALFIEWRRGHRTEDTEDTEGTEGTEDTLNFKRSFQGAAATARPSERNCRIGFQPVLGLHPQATLK